MIKTLITILFIGLSIGIGFLLGYFTKLMKDKELIPVNWQEYNRHWRITYKDKLSNFDEYLQKAILEFKLIKEHDIEDIVKYAANLKIKEEFINRPDKDVSYNTYLSTHSTDLTVYINDYYKQLLNADIE